MNHFLKNARAKRFLSIDKASAKVGVEPRTFKRWEHDDYNPQLYFLKKLCEAFDATPEELGYSISAEGKVSRIAPIHLRAQAYSDGIVAPAEQLVGHAAIELPTETAAPEPASRRSLARSRRCLRLPAQTKGVGCWFHPATVCSNQWITSWASLGC